MNMSVYFLTQWVSRSVTLSIKIVIYEIILNVFGKVNEVISEFCHTNRQYACRVASRAEDVKGGLEEC